MTDRGNGGSFAESACKEKTASVKGARTASLVILLSHIFTRSNNSERLRRRREDVSGETGRGKRSRITLSQITYKRVPETDQSYFGGIEVGLLCVGGCALSPAGLRDGATSGSQAKVLTTRNAFYIFRIAKEICTYPKYNQLGECRKLLTV